MLRVDIGCGFHPKAGYVGLDKRNCGQTYQCDIEVENLPFRDNSVDAIYCYYVLEHIHNLVHVMDEMWRVLKPGAILEVAVPHFLCRNAWIDPTHIRCFSEWSMDYYIPGMINKDAKEGRALFDKVQFDWCKDDGRLYWQLRKR